MNLFELEINIDEKWINSEYQHVHHADIVRLLEMARLAYLKKIGFSQESFFEKGIFLVIESIAVKYKREIKRGKILVNCSEPKVDGKALLLTQNILNEKGKLAVEARVSSMMLDAAKGRSIYPPPEFLAAFC